MQTIGPFIVNPHAVGAAETDLEFISMCAPTERIDVLELMWAHIEKLEAQLAAHGVPLPESDIRA